MIEKGIYAADYVIIAITLIITLGIGLFFAFNRGKPKTTADFFVGNRKLRVIPVSLSLSATAFSSILLVGFPAEIYTGGGVFWLYAVGIILGAIMVSLIFIPVFHPLKLTSMNHYLKLRYNSKLVIFIGTASQVIQMLALSGVVIFGQSTALAAMTGFPIWASTLIGSVLTISFTSLGGIKAVVWTDVFQSVIMLVSLIVITARAVAGVGDLGKVWQICGEWQRLDFGNFDPDPRVRFTFWSVVIGIGFFNFHRYGPSQMAVQRYASMPTVTDAVLCVLGIIPLGGLWITLASLSGLATFAYYANIGCDPIKAKYIFDQNQLVPYFVMDTLKYPGVAGIFLAGIISASVSTVSSALNSSAANVFDDIIKQFWPNLTERRNVLLTKITVILLGILSMILALFINLIGGTIVRFIIGFMSAVNGPTTSLFFLGLMFTFVTWQGAAVGSIVGAAFGLWMAMGPYTVNLASAGLPSPIGGCSVTGNTSFLPTASMMSSGVDPLNHTSMQPPGAGNDALYDFYSISYLWISLYAFIVPVIVGILVSLCTGCNKGAEVSPALLHPVVRRCLRRKDPKGEPIIAGPMSIDKKDDNDVKIATNV